MIPGPEVATLYRSDPSLARMRPTWVLVVCSAMTRVSLISELDRPWAISRSLYRQLGYHEEELLLTKAIPARHKHPNRQCHN
jgi:hypothetical protein